jgi:hypothetical protein
MIKDYINAILSPTPSLFKKIRRVGWALSGAGTAGIAYPNAHIQNLSSHAVIAGAALVAVASAATKKDDDDQAPRPPDPAPKN